MSKPLDQYPTPETAFALRDPDPVTALGRTCANLERRLAQMTEERDALKSANVRHALNSINAICECGGSKNQDGICPDCTTKTLIIDRDTTLAKLAKCREALKSISSSSDSTFCRNIARETPRTNQMNITERAQKVLTEIDAELAVCKAATNGPWTRYITEEWPPGWIGIRQGLKTDTLTETHVATVGRINDGESDSTFIANARTGYEATLKGMKIAIEGLLAGTGSLWEADTNQFSWSILDSLLSTWERSRE